VRPIFQGAGGAIARLPRDFGVPDDQLVWLLVNTVCGCGWGWVRQGEYGSRSLGRRLVRADVVEDELRHTAVHHLAGNGFSLEHAPAPGCTR
jgi:hypothetical protein